MRYQSPPNLDFAGYLELLVANKDEPTRSLVEANFPAIYARADEFVRGLESLAGIGCIEWPPLEGNAMRSCYESPTEVLGHLKDEILEHLEDESEINIQRCPYCMLNEPRTWDHFLPKGEYPELSVHYENLVYVCWSCNHRKAAYYDETHLEFCHPSHAVDPTEPVLHCQVTIDGRRLRIAFYCALHNQGDERMNVARRHVKNLDLVRRYQLESASVFSSFVGSLARDCPNGVSNLAFRASVTRRFEDVHNDLGPNAWEARFWHAVLRCKDVLAYVNDQIGLQIPNIRQGLEVEAPVG